MKDNETSNEADRYGGVFFNPPDAGTAHISVLSEDGDAVSVTSTLDILYVFFSLTFLSLLVIVNKCFIFFNFFFLSSFGAGVTSPETGITLSSGMDDFSWEDFPNYFNLPGSPANAISPQKRPLSSMSPSILVDRNGDVRLVVGAAGGTKIPTAVANVSSLFFKDLFYCKFCPQPF